MTDHAAPTGPTGATGLAFGSFLGCGFRIEAPDLPAARDHALAQVRALAALLGAPEPAESAHVCADSTGAAFEWTGGWPYTAGSGFGTLQSQIDARTLDLEVVGVGAVDVPFAVSTASPTHGLPTLAVPAYDTGADAVGLLANERGDLCGTTAGNLLVRVDGEWRRAEGASGVVPTWLHDAVAATVNAEAATLTRALLDRADDVIAVAALGRISVLRGSPDAVVAARARVLGR